MPRTKAKGEPKLKLTGDGDSKSRVNLSKIINMHSVDDITKTWNNLQNSITSQFDSTKKKIIWDKKTYTTHNHLGKKEHCWIVNVTRYGVGLKNGISIIPYHLALLSKLGDVDDEARENFKQQIKGLSPSGNHITHTCGNGRSMRKKDTQICCNPCHLEIRSKQYNASQAYCHYFLHLSETSRQKFFSSGLCEHDPKCF